MKHIIIVILVFLTGQVFAQEFENLAVGEQAENFVLKTLQGDEIELAKMIKKKEIVLVVLRGWPGYQCPICTRQVGRFLEDADIFAEMGVAVLMVYPGPSDVMQDRANEFIKDFKFPDNFFLTLDPDYTMINKYGLRWDEPKETAYPSTFVIDKKGKIVYSKISKKHGGRAKANDVFDVLEKL